MTLREKKFWKKLCEKEKMLVIRVFCPNFKFYVFYNIEFIVAIVFNLDKTKHVSSGNKLNLWSAGI